jgi:hypothetical protein
MKKFISYAIILFILFNFILSEIKFPHDETYEERIEKHVKKMGYHNKAELTKDEFFVICARFFPQYVNTKDSRDLRQVIAKHFNNIGDKVLRKDLVNIMNEDKMHKIIVEMIDIHNDIHDSYHEEFDKIDAEFKDEL